MIFTVELKGDPKRDAEVEIFLDEEALQLLSRRLALLQKTRSHTHFMTPSWSGTELTEAKMNPASDLVHHLRITMVPALK